MFLSVAGKLLLLYYLHSLVAATISVYLYCTAVSVTPEFVHDGI